MRTLRHLIPSSGSLYAFEAAARHMSFTRAGSELGMSQAAVSYAVRRLEEQLGVRLFRRGHRRVELTDQGERFFADVSVGLGYIRRSAENLAARAEARHVTLSASTAFASFWMLPRLERFRRDLPDIDLRIQTSDRDIDIAAEDIPLGIRAGDGVWPQYDSGRLAAEEIVVIASTSYLAAHGRPSTPQDLTGHILIHLDEPFRPCPDWREWLADVGASLPPGTKRLTINDYVLVVQAVLEGQGLALGWRHLTDRLVGTGVLTRVFDHVMRTGHDFHVVWPKDRRLNERARLVRDWLIEAGAREAR